MTFDAPKGVFTTEALAAQRVLDLQGALTKELIADGAGAVRILDGYELDHDHQASCFGMWWVIQELEVDKF